MSEYGAIFTQGGVSVRTAADYQKSLDTRWRFLDIEDEVEFDVTKYDWPATTAWWVVKIHQHNLGYLPAFTYREIERNRTLNSFDDTAEVIATTDAIYLRQLFVTADPTTAFRVRGFLRVFACPILETFKAPVEFIVPGAQMPVSDTGVKFLKSQAKGMYSAELSDYSVNTQGKSLAIQQTGTFEANAGNSHTLTIEHNMGYPPTYFVAKGETVAEFDLATIFADPLPNNDRIFPMDLAAGARITADTNFVRIVGGQSALVGHYGVLITKEPAEVAI